MDDEDQQPDDPARDYARQVLGAALSSQRGRDALTRLSAADFPWQRELLIAEAIRAMDAAAREVDPVTVSAELRERGTLARCGGSAGINALWSGLIVAENADYYAALLRGETRLRLARDEAQRAYSALAGHLDAREHSPEMVWEQRDAAESKIPAPLDDAEVDRSLAAFMASEDSAEQWIMPGLIARGERVVITGGEGLGKGVLLRQLAASVASGWHPFGFGKAEPARVLYVDLENPRPAIRQTFWQCHRALVWDYSGIELRYEPDGVDLLGAGLGWLHQVTGDYAPDLLVIGPAYKAIGDGDERDGAVVSRLLRRLDQVRRRHDVAVGVEQHSPHEQAGQQRTVRPVGSSMWRRWCDIGIGLRPHDMSQEDKADQFIASEAERAEWVDVVRWKPPRGPRDWPKQLRYGRPDQLPWIPEGHYQPRRIEVAA